MPMTKVDLYKTMAVARRFLAEAQALEDRRLAGESVYIGNPREQGLVRRASMDLTRALSKLRKGNL